MQFQFTNPHNFTNYAENYFFRKSAIIYQCSTDTVLRLFKMKFNTRNSNNKITTEKKITNSVPF